MSDKRRSITIGVVVAIFIVANIIAGVYKWGSSVKAPDNQVLQADKAGETGEQAKQVNEPTNEEQASKGPAAAPEEKTDSVETVEEPVIKEKDEVRSAEKMQPETDTGQSGLQQQILACNNEKHSLENQINGLRDELRDKQNLAAQNQQFSEQIRECSAARERLQKEMAEMQTGNSQYQELAARNEKLTDQAQDYANTTKNYEKEIAKLQSRIDQYQNLAAENKQLQAELENSKRNNEALKARLEKIRAMVDVE